MSHIKLGLWGESVAKDYLLQNDYRILDENFRTKVGEIDLVAYKDKYIIFIEVKTRSSTAFGFPSEAVGFKKQNRYLKIASNYLKYKNIKDCPFRFDVIEILRSNNSDYDINHIENAFQATSNKYYY